MDEKELVLRQKARLLIAREGEVLALRRRQNRLGIWLALAQRLPEFVDRKFDLWQACDLVSQQVTAMLDLQRAAFFEMPGSFSIRPLVAPGSLAPSSVEIGEAAWPLFEQAPGGVCAGDNDAAACALSAAVGLHRFLWYRMSVAGAGPILFVAGFDLQRASFYAAFNDDDLAHFFNTAHQLELLLGNINLVRALERDNQTLQQFNAELERRVEERTGALRASNRDLQAALEIVRRKDEHLDADIERARLFQATLLPRLPVCSRVEFAAVYRPLERVGGDVYDIYETGTGQYRIFIADATGHGVQAAMRTIVIKAEYDRLKDASLPPNLVLQELGRKLWSLFPNGDVMTTASCIDVALTPGGADVLYSNGGNPPLIHWQEETAIEVYGDGPFLGIDAPPFPPPLQFRMHARESLFVFTDGLSEQTDAAGTFFEERFRDTPFRRPSSSDEIAAIMHSFDQFRGATAATDDITLVGLRLTE